MCLRGGYFTYDDKDEGVYPNDRYVFNGSSNLPGVPAEFQAPSGTQNQTTIFSNTNDKYTRAQVAYDTTFFFQGGGDHQLKAGVMFDRRTNDSLYGETANLITFNWNAAVGGQRGTVRLLHRAHEPLDPGARVPRGRQDRHQQLAAVPPGLLDDRPQLHPEPRHPHRERDRPVVRRPGLRLRVGRDQVRLRRQDRPPRRLRVGRQGRRQVEGVRQLGHLLRHPQARPRPLVLRRRQVDPVLLLARHAELAEPRRRPELPGGPERLPRPPAALPRLPLPLERRDPVRHQADEDAGSGRRAPTTS